MQYANCISKTLNAEVAAVVIITFTLAGIALYRHIKLNRISTLQ